MSSLDNRRKTVAGVNVKRRMYELLKGLEKTKRIERLTKTYCVTDPKLIGENHFKVDFKVDFLDGSSWIIHCTKSIRSDRVKGNILEAEHIKRLNPNIEAAFLVYPDDQKTEELNEAAKMSWKIRNKRMYSKLDDILSFNSIIKLINSKSDSMSNRSLGRLYAINGDKFEKSIANLLNDTNNIAIWNGNKELESNSYNWFYTLLSKFGISEDQKLKEIIATQDVPNLKSGGKPKTDVIATIIYESGCNDVFTISCKNTKSDLVSMHQYSYQSFISALDIKEDLLKEALKHFQIYGGQRALKKNEPDSYEALNSLMRLYNEKLIKWVYFGDGGEGKGVQNADYLVSRNTETNSFTVLSKEQVIQTKSMLKINFETPFQWTFASKSKGKNIQLKGKV